MAKLLTLLAESVEYPFLMGTLLYAMCYVGSLLFEESGERRDAAGRVV
jgi:hypothetical protein